MKRLIEKKLIEWSDNLRRKPLLLRGARQVGKTFTIKEFGQKRFPGKIHTVDLEKHPEWHSIFEKNLDPFRIISDLEIALNKKINVQSDLLFFDEIQVSPRALLSLRYFYEETPELRVIAAGSLIEFALSEISFPVGRLQTLTMFPMNFIEFLFATGKDLLAEKLLSTERDFSDLVHKTLLAELKKYFFIGGMPEAVKYFAETGKMSAAFEVHRDLIFTFRNDFPKYGKMTDTGCLDSVLLSISKNAGRQIKYTKLAEGYSSHTIKKAFNLLCMANIAYKIPSVSQAGVPLGAFDSRKKFKALFLDIGLMQNLSGLPVDFEYRKEKLLSIYNGALAEQFVGQELLSRGDLEIFYWSRNSKSSSAEIDYLINIKGKLLPIEVKSGPAGKLKSLHIFLKTFEDIEAGYVFQESKFSKLTEQKLVFLPLYQAYNLV
ncbi:MAG: ATP-binding protein [Chlorobi bacterium]|nr:ATP-binding protein [Chlorobiota bacterium]